MGATHSNVKETCEGPDQQLSLKDTVLDEPVEQLLERFLEDMRIPLNVENAEKRWRTLRTLTYSQFVALCDRSELLSRMVHELSLQELMWACADLHRVSLVYPALKHFPQRSPSALIEEVGKQGQGRTGVMDAILLSYAIQLPRGYWEPRDNDELHWERTGSLQSLLQKQLPRIFCVLQVCMDFPVHGVTLLLLAKALAMILLHPTMLALMDKQPAEGDLGETEKLQSMYVTLVELTLHLVDQSRIVSFKSRHLPSASSQPDAKELVDRLKCFFKTELNEEQVVREMEEVQSLVSKVATEVAQQNKMLPVSTLTKDMDSLSQCLQYTYQVLFRNDIRSRVAQQTDTWETKDCKPETPSLDSSASSSVESSVSSSVDSASSVESSASSVESSVSVSVDSASVSVDSSAPSSVDSIPDSKQLIQSQSKKLQSQVAQVVAPQSKKGQQALDAWMQHQTKLMQLLNTVPGESSATWRERESKWDQANSYWQSNKVNATSQEQTTQVTKRLGQLRKSIDEDKHKQQLWKTAFDTEAAMSSVDDVDAKMRTYGDMKGQLTVMKDRVGEDRFKQLTGLVDHQMEKLTTRGQVQAAIAEDQRRETEMLSIDDIEKKTERLEERAESLSKAMIALAAKKAVVFRADEEQQYMELENRLKSKSDKLEEEREALREQTKRAVQSTETEKQIRAMLVSATGKSKDQLQEVRTAFQAVREKLTPQNASALEADIAKQVTQAESRQKDRHDAQQAIQSSLAHVREMDKLDEKKDQLMKISKRLSQVKSMFDGDAGEAKWTAWNSTVTDQQTSLQQLLKKAEQEKAAQQAKKAQAEAKLMQQAAAEAAKVAAQAEQKAQQARRIQAKAAEQKEAKEKQQAAKIAEAAQLAAKEHAQAEKKAQQAKRAAQEAAAAAQAAARDAAQKKSEQPPKVTQQPPKVTQQPPKVTQQPPKKVQQASTKPSLSQALPVAMQRLG